MRIAAFLFFIVPFFLLRAQINPQFVAHLSKNNLQREHAAYLSLFPSSDSLQYFNAKYFLQYGRPSEFLSSFSLSGKLFTADTSALNFASVYFLRAKYEDASKFFSLPQLSLHSSASVSQMTLLFSSVSNPKYSDSAFMPQPLRRKFATYKKYFDKKPAVAGLLSAVVPGLGKLYTGRKHSFINTLVLHLFFAATGVEAVSRLGWKHPYTIINLAYSGAFYVANIFGSVYDVKRVKKEKRKQFLLDAANYFELHNCCSLYPQR